MGASVSELLAAQLEQRAKVILSTVAAWSEEQAAVELHAGGPTGVSTLNHLVEVTVSTVNALGGVTREPESALGFLQARDRFMEVNQELTEMVRACSAEALQATPAIEIHPEFAHSLTTRQAFLLGHVFHLGYHAGQLGSLAARLQRRAAETP
ncbi:MAG: DinB family protein [Planctomycetes bacterium]|nr:DinB family protein [Planctomycetota bacterium]